MDSVKLSESVLLVVDAQRGFTDLCPEELPIAGGKEIVPRVNRLLQLPWARIDATQDWHPEGHCSFLGQRDNLYPPHCVINTPGANFLPRLQTKLFHAIWRKGFQKDFEAYAITHQYPAYATFLKKSGIKSAVICGLAANICCFYTARDLRKEKLRVFLLEDASAGVDVPEAGLFQDKAKAEGEKMGIRYLSVAELEELLVDGPSG